LTLWLDPERLDNLHWLDLNQKYYWDLDYFRLSAPSRQVKGIYCLDGCIKNLGCIQHKPDYIWRSQI
jgi:hypothetical protein